MESCSEEGEREHILGCKWILWAHLPHDTDWELKSYKKIFTFETVEQIIKFYEHLPDNLVKNCMLFIMHEGINPIWEDSRNRQGGCFSYKISTKNVVNVWRDLSFMLMGGSLAENNIVDSINGITISPKKNFCIIKIWLGDCENQNPQDINYFSGIDSNGCLFKKHLPQY